MFHIPLSSPPFRLFSSFLIIRLLSIHWFGTTPHSIHFRLSKPNCVTYLRLSLPKSPMTKYTMISHQLPSFLLPFINPDDEWVVNPFIFLVKLCTFSTTVYLKKSFLIPLSTLFKTTQLNHSSLGIYIDPRVVPLHFVASTWFCTTFSTSSLI